MFCESGSAPVRRRAGWPNGASSLLCPVLLQQRSQQAPGAALCQSSSQVLPNSPKKGFCPFVSAPGGAGGSWGPPARALWLLVG